MLSQQVLNSIFWDRPPLTLKKVEEILHQPHALDYYWLLGRLVERLSPQEIFTLIDRKQLYAVFPKLKIWSQLSTQKAQELFADTYASV